MPDYGLTLTGFVPKSLEILRAEINDALKASFGSSIDLSDGSILGNIVSIFAERLASLWELAEAVNASQDPRAATGERLEALAALTGLIRKPAESSSVTLTLAGTVGTVIPVASKVSTASTAVTFLTTEAGTLGALTAWAASTAYVVGDRRSNASRSYEVITAGTSAGSGGPTTTSSDITDGTVHWRYLGEGTAVDDVLAESEDTGPVVAVAYDLSNIDSPVAGWLSVLNLNDADLGSDIETDEALRIRRDDEISAAGVSTADAIRASLLEIDDVTEAHVFANNTDATDGAGVPPHSIEAVIRTVPITTATDNAIRQALFDEVAAGIYTHGSVTGTITDSEGVAQTIRFSRPTELNIYVIVDLIANQIGNANDDEKFPATGADLVKQAIVDGFSGEKTGRDVVASQVASKCFNVAGVIDVTSVKIGTSPSPTLSTTIPISLRQLANYDTSRITVNVTNGTP